MIDEDYWQNIGPGPERLPTFGRGGEQACLDIRRLSGRLPLDRKAGDMPGLDQLLPEDFFQASGTVFAVLDAGCLEGLPDLMEEEELVHANLFSGSLAETASDLAPYLVQLPRGSDLLKGLMTSKGDGSVAPGAYWGAQAGVFIRSSLSLHDLRRHLRRFLRVVDSGGKPYFFRFWQPECAEAYFRLLERNPAKTARWFFPHHLQGRLEALWLPVRTADGEEYLVGVEPSAALAEVPAESGEFRLSASEADAFRQVQWRRDVARISGMLRTSFPDRVETAPGRTAALCDRTMRRMAAQGFVHLDMLYMFCVWELHFGPGFETRDPTGSIAGLLAAQGSPEWRFARIKDAMLALEAQEV